MLCYSFTKIYLNFKDHSVQSKVHNHNGWHSNNYCHQVLWGLHRSDGVWTEPHDWVQKCFLYNFYIKPLDFIGHTIRGQDDGIDLKFHIKAGSTWIFSSPTSSLIDGAIGWPHRLFLTVLRARHLHLITTPLIKFLIQFESQPQAFESYHWHFLWTKCRDLIFCEIIKESKLSFLIIYTLGVSPP